MVDAECEASNFQTWSGDPRSVQRLFFDDFGCDEQVLLKSLKCEALSTGSRQGNRTAISSHTSSCCGHAKRRPRE